MRPYPALLRLLVVVAFAAARAAARAAADPAGTPPPPGRRAGPKYMLLDRRNVHAARGAELVLGQVSKHPGNPLVTEERDYEMRFDNMQPTVWFDPDPPAGRKKWRAWYSAFTNCTKPKSKVPMCDNAPQTCGTPTPPMAYGKAGRGEGFLYAESDDGLAWTKPNLGRVSWKGSTDNNLVEIGGMTTQIYLDPDAASAAERYKVVTGNNGAGAIAVSADGLTWTGAKDLQQDTHGRWDTPKNLVWDPARRQWIIYLRSAPTAVEPAGGSLRVQSYTHSLTEDFMGDWSEATPTGLNSSATYQPDGLLVFPYEGIYIGVGNVFNPSQTAGAVPIGQVNMVLAWSADGRHWDWLRPMESFVPLGKAGDFDACGVFSAKQDPLRVAGMDGGDTLRFYYTGCNGPFFGSRGCALGLATLQRDGFAGYRGGTVVTVPVAVAGDSLTLSLDGGNTLGVRVGVVGDPNRTAAACRPITGRHTDALVSWNGEPGTDLRMLYGAVQLEFVIPSDATLFAFMFWNTPAPRPSGVRVKATAADGARPANTQYGGGDFSKAWDGDTTTFYDYVNGDGGFTEATLDHPASVSCLRYFPRAQYLSGRYRGGTFVGFTSNGTAVPLATIAETPSIRWTLLNVSALEKVVRVRYNSPHGGFGNMAEIEVYERDQ